MVRETGRTRNKEGDVMSDQINWPWWINVGMRVGRYIPNVAGFARSEAERRKLKDLGLDLAIFAFWKDGVIAPLERIAKDGGRPSDIQEIGDWYQKTVADVTEANARIKDARGPFIAQIFSIDFADHLDQVVDEKVGDNGIRRSLKQIIDLGQCSPTTAQSILSDIEEFKRHLSEIHETVRAKSVESHASKKSTAKKKKAK